MILNTRLAELRCQKNLSKKEISISLGLEQSSYGKYELGQRQPSIEILQKLASFFEVSIDYLLGETDNPTPPNKTALTSFEAAKKLQEELSNIDIDIEKEGELETILNFIDTNKEMLKKLMNKE